MKLSRVFYQKVPGEGLLIYGIPVGQTKHLFDRYRNYLGWIQLPVILYTAVLQTMQYFPQYFAGRFLEIAVFLGVGFIVFTFVVMYLDLKFVFPNEREFMYNRTPYFERRFEALDKKLDAKFEEMKKASVVEHAEEKQ